MAVFGLATTASHGPAQGRLSVGNDAGRSLGAASFNRGCARSEREWAPTGNSRKGVSCFSSVPLAALLGPLQETGTVMGEPTVLDAMDQRPCDFVGGEARMVDGPMSCAFVGLAGTRGAECQYAVSAGRLGNADRGHEGAGLQRGEMVGKLAVMPGIGVARTI